jgi:hypothetical protein
MDFIAELIGAEEMQRIIAHGENEETTAIMLNPSVCPTKSHLYSLSDRPARYNCNTIIDS